MSGVGVTSTSSASAGIDSTSSDPDCSSSVTSISPSSSPVGVEISSTGSVGSSVAVGVLVRVIIASCVSDNVGVDKYYVYKNGSVLGTVTGMIRAFIQVQNLGGNVDASVLAGGIWEALVTTAAGLAVGIPSLIFYNWLQSKVEYYVFEMEDNSTAIIDMLIQRGEKTDEFSN